MVELVCCSEASVPFLLTSREREPLSLSTHFHYFLSLFLVGRREAERWHTPAVSLSLLCYLTARRQINTSLPPNREAADSEGEREMERERKHPTPDTLKHQPSTQTEADAHTHKIYNGDHHRENVNISQHWAPGLQCIFRAVQLDVPQWNDRVHMLVCWLKVEV